MNRSQRKAHLWAWVVLAPVLVAVLYWSYQNRVVMPTDASAVPMKPGNEAGS